jgi:hypothetical protein
MQVFQPSGKFTPNGFHMRFLTAAILFVLSMTLILVGIAQQTIWHPAATQSHTIHIGAKAPIVVIAHDALAQYDGSPTITAKSDRQIFMAAGRSTDISAWVGSTPHVTIGARGGKEKGLKGHTVAGKGFRADPKGSDLWRSEVTSVQLGKLKVDQRNGAGVLLASNGFEMAPRDITISWPIVFNDLPSKIFIGVGGLLLLAAVVLNWWSWYKLRRERGPRRRTPKAPQGPRTRRRKKAIAVPSHGRRSARNSMAVVATGLVLTSLSGCSLVAPKATPTASQAITKPAPPVVTEGQLRAIVERAAASINASDVKRDPKKPSDRLAGPALEARVAHYKLQAATKFAPKLPPIATDKITFALPASESTWPRMVMAVTSSGDKNVLPQMLVLEQAGPRDQYKVWYDINMLPGVQTPEVAATTVGAIPVRPDSLFLKISPKALPTAFGNLIDDGLSSLGAPMFNVTNDEFYKQVAASQAAQKASLKKAKLTVTHALGNDNVLSLATVNSGALVAVYLTDTYVIKPKDRTQAVAVTGMEKKLLGSGGSATGIKSVYGSMLLFYVPAINSSDKIITLGATQSLISIKSL